MWNGEIDWDQELTEDLKGKWALWCEKTEKLCDFFIRRICLLDYERKQAEVEVFSNV